MIYVIALMIAIPLSFIIDELVDRYYEKINHTKIKELEKYINELDKLQEKLREKYNDI